MSSNNNQKAIQTFYDLEIARCNEKWTDLPELAKRYKKYHPYESVLEFTARMEAEFILLIRQIRQEKYQSLNNASSSSSLTTRKSSTSQVDLPLQPPSSLISPPSSPVPQQTTVRKWGTRQFAASSTNLNNNTATTVTTTNTSSGGIAGAPGQFGIRTNYPEESDFIYQLDDPNHVSMHYRLLASSVQLVLVRLLDVIQRQIKSGELETPDDWQAQFSKIILARIYFETGRYEKTLEWLQHLALRLEDVETGYGLVLLVQARVMKGMCFEQAGNDTDALESYLAALQVVEQKLSQENNKALAYWIEDGLYRSILLQLRKKGPVKQTLKLMRTYLQYCIQSWPTDWRIHKRWIIFRHYLRYLTRAYQKGVYVPATPQDEYTTTTTGGGNRSVFSDAGETTLYERSLAALEETMQLMTQFRNLLATHASSPDKNALDIHHRTLELSNLLVSAHDTVGWGPMDYIKRTSKYFNRSRKLTFNSLCTTRHLFYTHVKLGETKQAKLALVCYFELLGVPNILNLVGNHDGGQEEEEDVEDKLEQVVDMLQNRLEYINEQSVMSASKNIWELELKFRKLQEEGEEEEKSEGSSGDDDEGVGHFAAIPKKKTPTGSCENDNEFDVVRLVLTATQQLYGNNKGDNGKEATILCDVAVALLEESETLKKKKASQYKSLMASSKRQRGVAYGLYASQCHDAEKRSEYLTESLLSLKRASELDSRSWQAFYQLGLQQTMMGDVLSASASIKRAIKLRGDFIPSWHLLALIQSSHQFHALPQSLQVIQAGLAYHLNMVDNFDNEELLAENLTLDTEEGQEFFERAEAYMKLRMTQAKLLETLEGSAAVLKVLPDLFDMFYKLSKKMNLVIAVPVLVVEKSTDLGGSVRSRKSSIARTNSSIHSNSSIFLPNVDDNESIDSSSNITEDNQEDMMRRPSSTNNNGLLKVNEEDEEEDLEEDDDEYFSGNNNNKKNEASKKSNHSRKSLNLSSKLMDDPLMSFPSAKKEKKEKNKDKPATTTKRSNFLSLKRSSNSEATLKKKEAEQQQKLLLQQQQLQKQQEEAALSALINNKESTTSRCNSASNYTVRSSSNNTLLPHQQSSIYSSLLTKQQGDSSLHLPSAAAIENDDYKQRQDRWQELVIQIWILASAMYARSARFEEAMKAITEADNLSYSHHADVRHRIGINLLLEAKDLLKNNRKKGGGEGKGLQERALDAFKRSLSIDPEHVDTHVSLATCFMDLKQFELAEQLLERSTKGLGWNRPEAWYLLSQVYRQQENVLDAKNCLQFALQLSETNPIVPLSSDLLPRFV